MHVFRGPATTRWLDWRLILGKTFGEGARSLGVDREQAERGHTVGDGRVYYSTEMIKQIVHNRQGSGG